MWLRGAMAAHLSSKQKVAGSIPVVASTFFNFSYADDILLQTESKEKYRRRNAGHSHPEDLLFLFRVIFDNHMFLLKINLHTLKIF
jgi:hypothetical protein